MDTSAPAAKEILHAVVVSLGSGRYVHSKETEMPQSVVIGEQIYYTVQLLDWDPP